MGALRYGFSLRVFNLQASMYYSVYYINILMMSIFIDFPKIFENSENSPKSFPKISEDFQRRTDDDIIIHRAANNFPNSAGQTYFCSDIFHFWPDKHRLRIAIKVPPSPLHMMFKNETSKFSKHLLYMNSDLDAG